MKWRIGNVGGKGSTRKGGKKSVKDGKKDTPSGGKKPVKDTRKNGERNTAGEAGIEARGELERFP